MRRLALVLSVVLFVGSSRADDWTNDVRIIRDRLNSIHRTQLSAIQNYLTATQYALLSDLYDELVALHDDLWDSNSDPISVRDDGVITLLNNLLYSLSDDIFPAILDIQTVLGSGDITSEILNLNALLQGVAADSSLIWSILDTAEDGGLIRTDPDYSGLQSILQNLGVSVSNFSDLLEELEDWHPDITGEVTATLDGPVVIGEMPEIDLSDIDFSYFDTWRTDALSLFENFPTKTIKGYVWPSNGVVGEGEASDAVATPEIVAGDFFQQVVSILALSANQSGEINRSLLEILAKIQPTNASAVASQYQTGLDSIDQSISSLSAIDVANNSSLQAFGSVHGRIGEYSSFNVLGSTFGASAPGNYMDIEIGAYVDRNGNNQPIELSINTGQISDFSRTAHNCTQIGWWLMSVLFDLWFVSRVYGWFHGVNQSFLGYMRETKTFSF